MCCIRIKINPSTCLVLLEGDHGTVHNPIQFELFARCHSILSFISLYWLESSKGGTGMVISCFSYPSSGSGKGLYHWPKSPSQLNLIKPAEPWNNGHTVPHKSMPCVMASSKLQPALIGNIFLASESERIPFKNVQRARMLPCLVMLSQI